MDQGMVVIEQIDSGKRVIEALVADGIDVRVAFWAQPSDAGKWYLYLGLTIVDEKGPAATYRLMLEYLKKMPDLWIEPFDLRVVGLKDSLAKAALAVLEANVPFSPFADRKPYPGMTRFGGSTLGGVSVDGGVYIYPPQPGFSAPTETSDVGAIS